MPRSTAVDRTQVLPFPKATDLHLRISRSFALITDWNAALAGHFPLQDVLQILVRQTEARNIALYRMTPSKVLPIATAARSYDATMPEHSSGALARILRAQQPGSLEPGSVWLLKDIAEGAGFESSPAAREWAGRPDILQVCLVVLEVSEDQADFIEMTFDTPPRPSPELPVSIVTQALADAWSLRSPGLVARVIRNYGRSRGPAETDSRGNILGADNPFALSRAEVRVAHLLLAGAKPKEIAEALKVSIPTVRSHLRNLYAKTETSGQLELVAAITASQGAG